MLKEKLRLLKERLKWWNMNIFWKYDLVGEEGVRITNEGDEVVDNVIGGELDLGVVEDDRKRRVCSDFWLNNKIKEIMLIQKS